MEHTVSGKTEVGGPSDFTVVTPCDSECTRKPASSADTTIGRLVDEKITDVIRMTVATMVITLESAGASSSLVSQAREKTLRLLGVKERRNAT